MTIHASQTRCVSGGNIIVSCWLLTVLLRSEIQSRFCRSIWNAQYNYKCRKICLWKHSRIKLKVVKTWDDDETKMYLNKLPFPIIIPSKATRFIWCANILCWGLSCLRLFGEYSMPWICLSCFICALATGCSECFPGFLPNRKMFKFQMSHSG